AVHCSAGRGAAGHGRRLRVASGRKVEIDATRRIVKGSLVPFIDTGQKIVRKTVSELIIRVVAGIAGSPQYRSAVYIHFISRKVARTRVEPINEPGHLGPAHRRCRLISTTSVFGNAEATERV